MSTSAKPTEPQSMTKTAMQEAKSIETAGENTVQELVETDGMSSEQILLVLG